MCGIAGCLAIGEGSFKIEESYINSIRDVDTMVLRGPDAFGTWISPSKDVAMAHRRLSIIDLSESARQPMINEEQSVVLSFNGEIYNHKEIRQELESLNKYKWITDHSDTEVILHAYEQWGIDCVQKLRGMFAFAIWNNKEEKLYLVRDRLGIKPLYYAKLDNRFLFASDVNSILEDKDIPRRINEDALSDYLTFLTVPAPSTMFEGIYKMESATYLCIDRMGTIQTFRYWDMLDEPVDLGGFSEDEIKKKLVKEIHESITIHKEADVPVGVFLSGGIDSSLNAILFSKYGKEKVATFTVAFDHAKADETNEDQMAAKLSEEINADHFTFNLNEQDLLDLLPQQVRLLGEPLADPVSGAQYYVSQLARNHGVIVCQLGEGVDELFIGYPYWITYKKAFQLASLKLPLWIKKFMLWAYGQFVDRENLQYEILRRYAHNEAVFWGTNDIFTLENKKNLLSATFQKRNPNLSSWKTVEQYHKRFQKKRKAAPWFRWMTYMDLNVRMPDLLLTKVDKMGMGVSLEARVPFLDHKVVEFVMGIPDELMEGHNNETKHFFKKSLIGIVPEEILNRKKMGFNMPVNKWYSGGLKNQIVNDIRSFAESVDYFDHSELNTLLEGKNTWKIWSIYTLSLWWKEYIQMKN